MVAHQPGASLTIIDFWTYFAERLSRIANLVRPLSPIIKHLHAAFQ